MEIKEFFVWRLNLQKFWKICVVIFVVSRLYFWYSCLYERRENKKANV